MTRRNPVVFQISQARSRLALPGRLVTAALALGLIAGAGPTLANGLGREAEAQTEIAAATSSPGGTLIVLNKSDATASVIDRASGSVLATLPTGAGPHEAAVSPDGKTAVVCDYGERTPGSTLTVIDLPSMTVSKTIDLGQPCRPHGIQFEPDGEHLVVTAEVLSEVLRVNVLSGEVVGRAPTRQRASHMVVLSPSGERGYVANIAPGTVSVVDVARGDLVKVIETGAGAEGIDISPDGREVWVTNRAADTVSVIDTQTLEVVKQIECGAFPIRVKFTPDGTRVLVSCAESGEVVVFDAKTRETVARIAMADEPGQGQEDGDAPDQGPVPIGILIPADGGHAYIANTNVDRVTVVDLETLKVTGRLAAGKTPDGMAWSVIEPQTD
ncbi:MAG: YVTN family beta-propeller protein [Phycisphaerales bacterium]|jgi:YVTN family beta-propeller protein